MRHTYLTVSVLAMFCQGALAQNIPDAGALMRQTEQMIKQSQMQRNAQRREALPPVMVFQDATVVTVKRIKFNGNTRLTAEQLQGVAMPFTNRPLAPQELQQLTDAVSDAYRQAGWVVRTYIPRQHLSGDELTLQVIENLSSGTLP